MLDGDQDEEKANQSAMQIQRFFDLTSRRAASLLSWY